MKLFFLFTLILFSKLAHSSCPNLAGTYELCFFNDEVYGNGLFISQYDTELGTNYLLDRGRSSIHYNVDGKTLYSTQTYNGRRIESEVKYYCENGFVKKYSKTQVNGKFFFEETETIVKVKNTITHTSKRIDHNGDVDQWEIHCR